MPLSDHRQHDPPKIVSSHTCPDDGASNVSVAGKLLPAVGPAVEVDGNDLPSEVCSSAEARDGVVDWSNACGVAGDRERADKAGIEGGNDWLGLVAPG